MRIRIKQGILGAAALAVCMASAPGARRVGADQVGRVHRPGRHRRRRRPDGALDPGHRRQEQPDEAVDGRRQQVAAAPAPRASLTSRAPGRSAQDHHHAVEPVHHAARDRRAVQLEGPDAGRDAGARPVRPVGQRRVRRTRPPRTTSTPSRRRAPSKFKMGGTGSKQEDQIITVAIEKADGARSSPIFPTRAAATSRCSWSASTSTRRSTTRSRRSRSGKAGALRPLCVFDDAAQRRTRTR